MSNLQVAVISDIHGNYHALTAVLDDIKQQKIQKIIVAGDSTGPTMQNQVFKILIEKKAIMIQGNGEKRIVRKNRDQISDKTWNQKQHTGNRWTYQDLKPEIQRYIYFLPDQRVLKFEGTSPIRVVHGSPHDTSFTQGILPEETSIDSKKLARVFNIINIEDAVRDLKESVLICGHTHRPWSRSLDNALVFNPGSVGNPCNGDPCADYAVLSWNNDHWSVDHRAVNYDLGAVYNSFQESSFLEKGGAFARTTLQCRLTGIDVNLEFLLHIKELRIDFSEDLMDIDQAYVTACKSFEWSKYNIDNSACVDSIHYDL
ncbi:metallophosphoesterase family protein [Thermoproteota archaeon]